MPECPEICAIVARVMGVSEDAISAGARREDLAVWDSMNHLRLMMELEAAFGVKLSTEQMLAISSVADIIVALEQARGR